MAAVTTADRQTREDLSAAAEVLDQRGTPFFTAVKNGPAPENHLIYSKAVDTMGKRMKGGVPERQDIKAFEGGKSERIYARCERFQRWPAITTEAEEFSGASASQTLKDYNAQVAQKIKETKRDIEYWALSDQESQDDDGINGYLFRGAGRTVNDGASGAATSTYDADGDGTNDIGFVDTATAIPTNLRTPTAQIYTGTTANFLEPNLNSMMQNRYQHAGMSGSFTLWVGYAMKNQISSNFGRYVPNKSNYTVVARYDASSPEMGKVVTSGIDIFEGDYGNATVELDPWMPTNARFYGFDMMQLMKRVKYLARHSELENKGGGRRGLIDSILSFWFGDPRTHIKGAPSDEVPAVIDYEF